MLANKRRFTVCVICTGMYNIYTMYNDEAGKQGNGFKVYIYMPTSVKLMFVNDSYK